MGGGLDRSEVLCCNTRAHAITGDYTYKYLGKKKARAETTVCRRVERGP